MRLTTFVGLGLSVAITLLAASCSNPAQPAYADISYQSRCRHLDGSPIVGCTTPVPRDIFGFSGDMGQRFSCTIAERAATRTVNFTVTARTGTTNLGVSLANATVPIGGGAPSGSCTFNWTDGNTHGGPCWANAPDAAHPCQVSNIAFTTDTATGLPLTDVSIYCIDAPSIPTVDPPQARGVSRVGTDPGDDTSPFVVHFYSCPVIQQR